MKLVDGIDAQIVRVFDNLKAVAEAAGGSLADIVKLNVLPHRSGELHHRQ
jgi:enamine deaminase RidA (YjgF/YER057c/UK114 family)